MIQKIFSIYDSKAEAFITPFFAPTAGVAIRSFATAANDEQHNFHQHADDYTLFEIGTFNSDTGDLIPHEAGISHGLALSHINTQ